MEDVLEIFEVRIALGWTSDREEIHNQAKCHRRICRRSWFSRSEMRQLHDDERHIEKTTPKNGLSALCWRSGRDLNRRPSGYEPDELPTVPPRARFMPASALTATTERQKTGAGEESRTLDLYLGKVSLYPLSYMGSFNPDNVHSGTKKRGTT